MARESNDITTDKVDGWRETDDDNEVIRMSRTAGSAKQQETAFNITGIFKMVAHPK